MADRSFRVVVLEGDFAGLSAAGFPLSLCVRLQQSALKLPDAMWTAKSTAGGFSVSLFWPTVSSQPCYDKKETKKSRRKRKRKTKAKSSAQCEHTSTKTAAKLQSSPAPPTDAHLGPESEAKQNNSLTSTSTQVNMEKGIDLNSCSDVRYDKRGTVHGVTYSIDDREGWTPVIGKRVKKSVPVHPLRRRAPPHVKAALPPSDESTSYDSDDSDCSTDPDHLVIPDHATVNFSIVDGKPGLQVNTRCTRSWTPIAARTRAKLKS